jgi:hypothetical protein
VLSGLGVTISAVYRLVAARLEGYLGLFAALAAGGGIHLARASTGKAAAAVAEFFGPSGGPASRTALGLISEPFGSEEFLLLSSKGERFSAIGTCEGFLCESH